MNQTPDIESRSFEEISAFQLVKFREALKYLASHSPYYQRLFARENIAVDSIKELRDIVHLPTTTKDDFQQHNWDFLCVPMSGIVEYTSTS